MTTLAQDIALLRLVAQRLAGPRPATAADAVRRLTAAQAPGPARARCRRSPCGRRRARRRRRRGRAGRRRGRPVLADARHPAPRRRRGPAAGCSTLLGARALAGAPARRAQLGLTDAQIEQARELAVEALSGGRRLRRAELLAALARRRRRDHRAARLPPALVPVADRHALPRPDGGDGEQLLRAARRVDPRAAAAGPARRRSAELARRFFRGHGPATVKDLARWAGLRITRVRAPAWPPSATGWPGSRSTASSTSSTRRPPTGWPPPATEAAAAPLLPGFDEFVLGYGDRTCRVPAEFADRIVPGGNGMFRPTVVSGGRVVGTWRWTGRGAKRTVSRDAVHRASPTTVAAAVPALAAALPVTGQRPALDQEDGDLAVGPLLVVGVRREGGDRPLPPHRLLLAGDLAGDAVPRLGAVLHGHLVGVRAQVGAPTPGPSGAPPCEPTIA